MLQASISPGTALGATIATWAPHRVPTPQRSSGAVATPVYLELAPTTPAGLTYNLVSYWEERCQGVVQRTTITKALALSWQLLTGGEATLVYKVAALALQKPNLTALESALLLLATLYQRLELAATSGGRLLALRNHAEVLATWANVKQELMRRSGGTDEITRILVDSVGTQLQDPARLLASLRHDYAFAFLLPDVYQQRFEDGLEYGQAREFSQFFAGTSLWFNERLTVAAATSPAWAVLHLRGQLDEQRTDLAAATAQATANLVAATGRQPASPLPRLRGTYEATLDLDATTGWPIRVEVMVRAEAGRDYSKEYFLRLEQLVPQ